MTQAAPRLSQPMTLAEYLDYDSAADIRYELVDGALVEVTSESPENCKLAKLLMLELAKHVSIIFISLKDLEVAVSGRRATVRLPDLAVVDEEGFSALSTQRSNTITHDMPPPVLVVEVVSPGRENRNRDYRHKHTEYAARGIAEYWIIDPELQQVMLCLWVDGQYEDTIYKSDTPLKSTVIQSFNLTAKQILALGEI
ncbi:MAG: Uma2 family endonuclease [Cyanobacteria bacterium J06614_10]